MYFIGKYKFDINKNNYHSLKDLQYCLSYPEEFLKTYTTLNTNTIEKLEVDEYEEIIKFVHGQLDISDPQLVINLTDRFVSRYNKDITFFIISLLSKKGYKVNEMLKWDLNLLFDTFYLETVNTKEMELFIQASEAYFDKDTSYALSKRLISQEDNFKEREELCNIIGNIN